MQIMYLLFTEHDVAQNSHDLYTENSVFLLRRHVGIYFFELYYIHFVYYTNENWIFPVWD